MEKLPYDKRIAAAIRKNLDENGINYSFDADRAQFLFGAKLNCALDKAYYLIFVLDEDFLVYATADILADTKNKTVMTELSDFIHLITPRTIKGNFELDIDHGAVSFKYFVTCCGITPNKKKIENAVGLPGYMFQKYGSCISDIIQGKTTAREALAGCETLPLIEDGEIIGIPSVRSNAGGLFS